MSNRQPITLGALRDAIARANPAAEVRYDQFGLVWGGALESWRGDYSQPALNWRRYDERPDHWRAGDMLKLIDEAIGGARFTGYKGGEYTFRRSSRIHVDRYGESTGTALVGVRIEPNIDGADIVWLMTAGSL